MLALLVCLPLIAVAQQPQDQVAFIELSASEDEVYVQQLLRLTVKLYYTNQVVQGQLSEPEHPDVVIEESGEQKQYQERLDGESYRVVEREYLIFPQNPGKLQLPPLEFQGTARHPRGHHYRVSDSATLFPVTVRDIPAGFSGNTWLPATDLTLTARGLERTGPVAPGDNLTRTLTLTARGLPATTLPSLDAQYPETIRSYPEPEQRQSSPGADGLVGELQQTTALVPISGQGGEITLPEVRIPWWDVAEDREKVAVLPARTIRLTSSSGPDPVEPVEPVAEPAGGVPGSDRESSPTPSWLWPILAGLLTIGWATTVAAWWLCSRRSRPAVADTRAPGRETEHFRRLHDQAKALDPAFFNQVPPWGRELTGQSCRTTDEALSILDDNHLTGLVDRWRESLYRPEGGAPPDGNQLAEALKAARKRWLAGASKGHGKGQALPDLYPEGLNP
jgi:hypothetical protein